MKGYKATNQDMTCRGFNYELNQTYKAEGDIRLCENGFHFCDTIADTFVFYDKHNSRFFEVEAEGVIKSKGKNVASEITLVRELEPLEVNRAKYGNGYGNGYGDGYGNGNGFGYGYGYGDGYGYGYGYGNGFGYGDGDGDIQKIAIFK